MLVNLDRNGGRTRRGLRLGQPEQALAYFQRALQVNPNLAQVEAMIEELKQVLIEKRKGTI